MAELQDVSQLIPPRNLQNCRTVIRELLSQHRLNASELARRIHLPQPTIHRLLTGKTEDPKLSTISLIADFFGVTLDQLLGDSPVNGFEKILKTHTHSAPIITWNDAISIDQAFLNLSTNHSIKYINIDMETSSQSFGLISKKSMEPNIAFGTLLIIDPLEKPIDGDLVIVHYHGTNDATIRKLVLDGPKQELHTIFNDTQPEKITDKTRVIGIVIQTRFSYR
jgi:SOS-response transcriptional repressor LexA